MKALLESQMQQVRDCLDNFVERIERYQSLGGIGVAVATAELSEALLALQRLLCGPRPLGEKMGCYELPLPKPRRLAAPRSRRKAA